MMGAGTRKFVLTLHVISSIGLVGAVACFFALALIGLATETVRIEAGVYVAMDVIAWCVILPLAIAALMIGLIQSLGTSWGLFRHYWVLAKFIVTVFVVLVLSLQMSSITKVAQVASYGPLEPALFEARLSMAIHAGAGLLVLLIPVALSIYKPRGRTRYGERVERAR